MRHQILIRKSCSGFSFSTLDLFPPLGIYKILPSSKRIKSLSYKILEEQCRLDALDSLGLSFELSILLCGDREIRKLNEKYRKKKKATDVLSFPLLAFPRGPGTSQKKTVRESLQQNDFFLGTSIQKSGGKKLLALGDVVISCPSCIRQAMLGKSREQKLYKKRDLKNVLGFLSRFFLLVEIVKKRKNACAHLLQIVESEFSRLLIHAILHLFGYDHESSRKDEIRMHKRERLLYKHLMLP